MTNIDFWKLISVSALVLGTAACSDDDTSGGGSAGGGHGGAPTAVGGSDAAGSPATLGGSTLGGDPSDTAGAAGAPTRPAGGAGGSHSEPTLPLVLAGFSMPESALHDTENDLYLISDMGQGTPVDVDGNGRIVRVAPDGILIDQDFFTADAGSLNAPKGMALVGAELFVADIDQIRVFDRDSGVLLRSVEVEDAVFLNDVAALEDGSLVVTDSGLTLGEEGLVPVGGDAIYHMGTEDELEVWQRDDTLGAPNGAVFCRDRVWVVTYGSGELLELDLEGRLLDRNTPPGGGFDGVVCLDDGRLLFSGWNESSLYFVSTSLEFSVERTGVEGPADIGVDASRGRVIIPHLSAGNVTIDRIVAE